MRALVTGIGGFVGGHLATLLRQEDAEVWGIDCRPLSGDVVHRNVVMRIGDLCDRAFTSRALREAKPTHVFHLATTFDRSDVPSATESDSNVVAVSSMLDALNECAGAATIMIASSSAVYGSAGRESIEEPTPLKPTTAYGASKKAVEATATRYRVERGMNVLVARTFNLLGPGMPRRLFAGSLATQIATAERGGSREIKVGRLDSSRDYVDVRDAVKAYVSLATRPGLLETVYNICAGVSHSSRELALAMLALARVPIKLKHDASRLQGGDVDYQRGSPARLQREAGWKPSISFSASVCDTLDHERQQRG